MAAFRLVSLPPLDFGFRLGGIDIGKPWEGCSKDVQRWLADVRANHEAPDLWAEARKARTLADAAGNVSGDNSPFTPVELSELQPRLNEIEAYIESQQPQDSARQETLRSRFKYLYGAAKRGMGRIDWLNVFVGQLFQMAVDGLVKANVFSDIMRYAARSLEPVLKFMSSKLLGP